MSDAICKSYTCPNFSTLRPEFALFYESRDNGGLEVQIKQAGPVLLDLKRHPE